jgi:hypothetical protein
VGSKDLSSRSGIGKPEKGMVALNGDLYDRVYHLFTAEGKPMLRTAKRSVQRKATM